MEDDENVTQALAEVSLGLSQKFLIFCRAFLLHFCLDLWNFIDLVSYVLSILNVVLWIQFFQNAFVSLYVQYERPTWEACQSQIGDWCSDGDLMDHFETAALLQQAVIRTASLNVIFICSRLLKFFRNVERVQVIFRTLKGGFTDISW